MKNIFAILFIIQISYSYGQSSYKIENILFDCLLESYTKEGIDLNQELLTFESYLISVGSLKSENGQAYFDYYKEVVRLNDFPGVLDCEKLERIHRLNPNKYYTTECLEKLTRLDSIAIKNSKYYQMNIKVKEVTKTGKINPSLVAEAILSVLLPEDFEKPYYRAIALLTIAHTSNPLGSELAVDRNIDYSDYVSFELEITERDKILLDKSIIDTVVLENRLRDFIIENESKHIVHYKANEETSYDFYIKIYDLILDTYARIKTEKSIELFGKEFDDLSESERLIIEAKYKKNIHNKLVYNTN